MYLTFRVDHYCWDAGQGLYFDYDCEAKKRLVYETCTALWVLYAGMASEEQGEEAKWSLIQVLMLWTVSNALCISVCQLRVLCTVVWPSSKCPVASCPARKPPLAKSAWITPTDSGTGLKFGHLTKFLLGWVWPGMASTLKPSVWLTAGRTL